MCLKLCLTILFVLCCCCGKGQNEVAVENDSILMAYYKKCKANLDSPLLWICVILCSCGARKRVTDG